MDAIFLGLLVEMQHRADIKKAKMDGKTVIALY